LASGKRHVPSRNSVNKDLACEYKFFKVAEIMRPIKTKASLYKLLRPDSKLIDRWFLCQDLLKIDPKNLMKELETIATFVVEKVLDKEVLADGKVKYLVKWYGYGDKDNTWELSQESFQSVIDEYKTKKEEEQLQESENVQIARIQLRIQVLSKSKKIQQKTQANPKKYGRKPRQIQKNTTRNPGNSKKVLPSSQNKPRDIDYTLLHPIST
jgi:hypothetical protein